MGNNLKKRFIQPSCWLLYGLPWPDPNVEMAEAAVILAPPCVPQRDVSENVYAILAFTQRYADEHPNQRLVFLTDVTRWLGHQDSSWQAVGVDIDGGLQELMRARVLSLHSTVSRRAYMHITNAALVNHTVFYTDGTSEVLTEEERERVRSALREKAIVNWSDYIRSMLKMGRLTFG